MLNTASIWLDETLAASDGETVTYQAGAENVSLTDVVIGETPIGFDFGQSGIFQSWQTTDFFIPTASLVLFGSEFLPVAGHRIVRTVRDKLVPYEIRPAEDGRCWRYSDKVTETMLRVHAKEVLGKEDVA